MKVNRFKMFLKLYQKEMLGLKTEILLTVLGVIGAAILSYTVGARLNWTNGLLVATGGLAALLPVITAGKIFSKEFDHNTIYLVMSLPVRGSMILGSKLAAVVSQYLAGTIVFMVCTAALILNLLPVEINIIIEEIGSIPWGLFSVVYFLSVAFGTYLVTLIFFSQIVGKLVAKFQGFITAFTLVGTFWITHKFMGAMIGYHEENVSMLIPPVEPFLYASLLYVGIALAIFIAAVLIYNWRIEL